MNKRHRQCLQNIARLERELLPHLFARKVDWLEDGSIAPGVKWEVQAWNDITVFHNAYNLLGSGEHARAREEKP